MSAATIMIVDDELTIRNLLEMQLSAHGYNVVGFADGFSALASIDEGLPDLAITQVELSALRRKM